MKTYHFALEPLIRAAPDVATTRQLVGILPRSDIKALAEGSRLLLVESLALFHGTRVTLPDSDRDFAQTLMDAEIDAVLGDVHLPYPFFLVDVPSGLKLPSGRALPGLCVSAFGPNVPEAFVSHSILPTMHGCVVSAKFDDDDGHSWFHFPIGVSNPLDNLPTQLSAVDSQDLRACVHFVLALCLYIQALTPRVALIPSPDHRGRVPLNPGTSAASARRLKRLPRQTVYPYRPTQTQGRGQTHRAAHWRRLHLRALRDSRYARNADGSVRIIIVRPTLVGKT